MRSLTVFAGRCARLFFSSSFSFRHEKTLSKQYLPLYFSVQTSVDCKSNNHTCLIKCMCIFLCLYVLYSHICNTVRPLFTLCKFAINLPVEILFGCNLTTQNDFSNQVCLAVIQYKHTHSITFPATCVPMYILYLCVRVLTKPTNTLRMTL